MRPSNDLQRLSHTTVRSTLCAILLAAATSQPHAAEGDEPAVCADPGSHPGSQLSCYCEAVGKPVAANDNLIAPCYLGSVQLAAFLNFALYSAWSWSALNWPVSDDNGVPDYDVDLRRVQGDNATVWESWKTTREVFRADGSPPLPWASRQQILPASCAAIDVVAAKSSFAHADSVPDALPPRVLTDYLNAEGDVVIDRNGELLRYETAMNRVAYDYIVGNGLYSADRQQAFHEQGGKISFPAGTYYPARRGSYWAKAAWKVLGQNDRFDDIHKAWAYLYPLVENGTLVSGCSLKPVGLVGLHITYKLDQATNWAWATFEHARNAPTWDLLRESRDTYLFYDPDCMASGTCTALNTAPRLFASPRASQLVMQQGYGYGFVCKNPGDCRDGNVGWINATYAKQLSTNVWGSYRLKGTQWVDGTTTRPEILANTVIEPYIQSTSSCLGCHRPATTKGLADTGKAIPGAPLADKIFALQKARPELELR